jgi:hypothetical protein
MGKIKYNDHVTKKKRETDVTQREGETWEEIEEKWLWEDRERWRCFVIRQRSML